MTNSLPITQEPIISTGVQVILRYDSTRHAENMLSKLQLGTVPVVRDLSMVRPGLGIYLFDILGNLINARITDYKLLVDVYWVGPAKVMMYDAVAACSKEGLAPFVNILSDYLMSGDPAKPPELVRVIAASVEFRGVNSYDDTGD